MRAIINIGEIIQIGGAPTPPGFASKIDNTSPPATLKPGSSKIRDGCKINSKDQGAFTAIGAKISAMRRRFRRSKLSLFIGLVFELNATTSNITKINCHSTIDINANGENPQTIANKRVNHHVLRQLKFSSCSRPNSALTNQGPITISTTVPSRPLLTAANVVGENA